MEDSPTLYRHVIAAAWRMSWRHKFLWVYGFFATVLSTGGVVDVVFRGWNDATVARIFKSIPDGGPSLPDIISIGVRTGQFPAPPAWAVILFVILFFLGASLLWISVISQGALVAASAAFRRGKTPDPREVFRAGLTRFWPVLGVNFITRVLAGVALFLTALPVSRLLTEESPRAAGLYILSFLVFVPLALIVSFLSIYAVAAIVIRKETFLGGVVSAWLTFSRHWLVSLEMAFVILAIDLVFALGIFIGLFVLILPFAFLLLMVQLVGTKVSLIIVLILAGVALLSFIIAAGSFVSTFRSTAWTLLFLRLEERGGVPKIVRVLRAIPRYLSH